MTSETWLDMAARLQLALVAPPTGEALTGEEAAARERIKPALWLRREFEAEPLAANFLPFQSDD